MSDLTLRQLRYFAVLGEELNYRRAAERLFITQPALSTAIKQLEQSFGVVLFNRNTREVALTDLGALSHHAQNQNFSRSSVWHLSRSADHT